MGDNARVKIALAADHAAVEAKSALVHDLVSLGHEVFDFGTQGTDSVDYPDFSEPAARAVASGEFERGILLCGTGLGQSMVANKIRGIRAALIWNEATATMSRCHNDANVACFGARLLPLATIRDLARLWLATPFEGGRHARRVGKIDAIDPTL